MATKIGSIEIEVSSVSHMRTVKDECGNWLTGYPSVSWSGSVGGIRYENDIDISIGCWDDTDDDNAEWAAWHEGARVIEKCLGGTGDGDMRGTAVAIAFSDEAKELGSALCRMLRAAAATEDRCEYSES